MKLYYYDSKHERLIAEKDLGNISPEQETLIQGILDFLEEKGVVDGRYKALELGNSIKTIYNDGEPELVIE